MATFKIYKLHFTSPLHISDQHEDNSYSMKTIHSDMLYAAFTSCLAKTGVKFPSDGNLGFVVSSMFPYYQLDEKEKPVYFLPIPMCAKRSELADPLMAKKMKKVQWVDSTLYSAFLSGEALDGGVGEFFPYIQESYLSHFQLPEDLSGSKEFVKSEISQRVTIESRLGHEDAKPYFVDRVLFRHYSGLYFLAEGNTSLLDKALQILSLEGIGTDRNVGFGYFDFDTDEIMIDLPREANHQVSLSLLIPESKEQLSILLDSEDVAYDFIRRGGWITTFPYNSLRKNAIYGFLPGSVFYKDPEKDCETIGKIVDLKPELGELTPNHPIWRNGKAIMLPVKLNS